MLQIVRHHKSGTSEEHAKETKAAAQPAPSLPSHDLSVQFIVPLKKFKTFATNRNDPPYYSPISAFVAGLTCVTEGENS